MRIMQCLLYLSYEEINKYFKEGQQLEYGSLKNLPCLAVHLVGWFDRKTTLPERITSLLRF